MRPDIGTQARFQKKKPPTTYRYDSSLSAALDWDGRTRLARLGDGCWRASTTRRDCRLLIASTPRELRSRDGRVHLLVASLEEAVVQRLKPKGFDDLPT
jgi:adenine-specific DNA-methyltransferase